MLMVADISLGSFIWSALSIFFLVMYLMMLLSVLTDLFRDHTLNGGAKAVWLIALLFLPLISLLAYVIVRGDGMAKRQAKAAEDAEDAARSYIQNVAGTSPAEQITQAKALLDQGVISQEEFDLMKERALSS